MKVLLAQIGHGTAVVALDVASVRRLALQRHVRLVVLAKVVVDGVVVDVVAVVVGRLVVAVALAGRLLADASLRRVFLIVSKRLGCIHSRLRY